MMANLRWTVVLGLLGMSIATGAGPVLPRWSAHAPWPELARVAEAAGLPLAGFEQAGERERLVAGDEVVLLATLEEGARLRQWLLHLTVVGLEATEREAAVGEARLFTSTGREISFAGARAAMDVVTTGPFERGRASGGVKTERARIVVNSAFLELGFARAAMVIDRLRRRREERPELAAGAFNVAGQPFPEEVVRAGREIAAQFELSEADERALAGTLPAMMEFFGVAARTPGLKDVLFAVVDVPWWSVVKSGGRMPGVGFNFLSSAVGAEDPAAWPPAGAEAVWTNPFVMLLNQKPALVCRLVATEPRPPLSALAGVVGLAAGRPDGSKGTLSVAVLASRAGPENGLADEPRP